MRGGEAELRINAIYAKEKFITGKIIQHPFRMQSCTGGGTFSQHTAEHDHFNIGMTVQFRCHVEGGRYHGQFFSRTDMTGQ